MGTKVKFSILQGLVLKRIQGDVESEELGFITECGRTFRMLHFQNCCERVTLEDICGDFNDLIGYPIIEASETSNSEEEPIPSDDDDNNTHWTWTFYRLSTVKGTVTLRWFGKSNGYYSEKVDFIEKSE